MGKTKPIPFRNKETEEQLRKVKIQICNDLKRAFRRRHWTQTIAAFQCGTTRQRMIKIDKLRVDELTLSYLFRCLAVAAPDFDMLIAIY